MPVSWVSLKAGIMSHLIMRSGPKNIPEVQTLSMTSLDPISTQSWSSWDWGKMQASLFPSPPVTPENITLMLRAPCVMEAAAVPGQENRGSFLPIPLLHKGTRLQEDLATPSHLPMSCPFGTAGLPHVRPSWGALCPRRKHSAHPETQERFWEPCSESKPLGFVSFLFCFA